MLGDWWPIYTKLSDGSLCVNIIVIHQALVGYAPLLKLGADVHKGSKVEWVFQLQL